MKLLIPALLALTSAPAMAQSFNIDWGSPDHVPSDAYAGVGLAGVWNNFDSMPTFQRLPLVGLDGEPIAADIMNIGFDVIESADLPGPVGDDAALLDDCFTSFNDPVDGCLFIRFMEPGEYRVILYGVAPDDPLLRSRMRIDQNAEDPVEVGGAWPGSHQPGVTYMEQIATVGDDGRLDFHSGLPSAEVRSVLNAMQVVKLEACVADLAEPAGVLDFSDVVAFLGAFSTGGPEADLAEPIGAFDFSDVVAFLGAFAAGCP